MAPKIIDEQSLLAREQEIIDAAIELIGANGIENLTMDKVVAKVSYSKGTVYKHFVGKEDVLQAISNRALNVLSELFCRAANYPSVARERMLLLNFSYLIYAILHPALFHSAICARSPNVSGKSSENRLAEQEGLEMKLLGAIHSIVEQGVSEGNLTIPSYMNITQLCFANWSGSFGVISLLSGEVDQCSGRTDLVVERELLIQNNIFFDGLAWAPMTKQHNYDQALRHALEQVFPNELAALTKLGRSLNF